MSRARWAGAAAVAAGVAAVVAAPYVLPSYVVSLLTLMFIAALLAGSVNLLAGLAGLVSIGHAGIAAAGAYGVAWATVHELGLAPALGVAAALTLIMIDAGALNVAPVADLESTVVRSATPANVDTVMIDGRILKRHRELVAVDVARVVREAEESARAVRARAGGRLRPDP
jgi:hypothetical protein